MTFPLCEGSRLWDIGDSCVQTVWRAAIPVLLIATFYLSSIRISPRGCISRAWDHLKASLLTLEEAEALTVPHSLPYSAHEIPTEHGSPMWRTTPLVLLALLEFCGWALLGIYQFYRNGRHSWEAICSVVIGITWLYNVLTPALHPKATAYIDLFILYTAHLVFAVITLGNSLYHFHVIATPVHILQWIGMIANIVIIIIGLGLLSTMPLRVVRDAIKNEVYVTCSPEDYASIFEWATYSWVCPLIKRGSRTDMNEGNVWDLSPAMQSRPVFAKFSTIRFRSLSRRLLMANLLDIALDILLTFVTVLLSYASPYFLRNILELIDNPTPENRSRAYIQAFLACLCALLKGEADAQHLFFGRRASARVRVQLMDTIYDKALKRRYCSGVVTQDATTTSGETVPRQNANVDDVVNLMATDANEISSMVGSAYLLYGGLLEMSLAVTFLFSLLGPAAFAGLFVIFIGWALHSIVTRIGIQTQKELSTSRDHRRTILNELVKSIKCIKFFAWENHWIKRVLTARDREMQWMWKSCINAICSSLVWASPVLVSMASFLVYVYIGNQLTASVAFTSIVLVGMLRQPLNIFPSLIVQAFQIRDSLKRIEGFLNEKEVSEQVSLRRNRGVVFSLQDFGLHNISIRFPVEKLSLITGPTGSGKTALLLALLGEMTKVQGNLNLSKDTHPPTISYAAQTPWLQRRTIKENILFGYQYDEPRYKDVIECCALRPDLDMLEYGDETEIGDRGMNLSGGQRARIALARAVYARSRYVLLDDPLCAVDNGIQRNLFEKLLCGQLLRNRTVILVTHHLDLVRPHASCVVHMFEGTIRRVEDEVPHTHPLPMNSVGEEQQRVNESRGNKNRPSPISHIQDKSVEKSGITFSTCMTYLRASACMWCVFALFIVCSQVMVVVTKLWIREWSHSHGNDQMATISPVPTRWSDKALVENAGYWLDHATIPDARDRPLFYAVVYAIIGSLSVLLSVGSTFMQYIATFRASHSLFERLLRRVVHATMHWHDITPNGRLLNRFSKDMDAIDSTLSNSIFTVSNSLVAFGVAVLTVAIFFPAFLVPATLIAIFYCWIAKRYLSISGHLRRMESTSKPPTYAGFGEVLEGIVTIRAFSAEHRFMEEFHKKIDVATKMYYNFWMTNRWLLINFDALGALAILITTLLALFEHVPAGTAGLCITSAMSFTMNVYLACRSWTSLELDLSAVERVAEYLDIPQEPSVTTMPPAYWPSSTKGKVLMSVENLSVSYAPKESPPVLHNISFTLNGGERVGILGRSGSGKSTLVMSMLRFVDPVEGRVMIDGIDISTISVHDLRSRVTYIPENPVLFSGTLRENVDPFNEHANHECEGVLRCVQLLGERVYESRRDNGSRSTIALDTQVAPGGSNFSQGQRQLIAMARALLRPCHIIILDEATNSIDFDIDAKIQATIREYFANSLLITSEFFTPDLAELIEWLNVLAVAHRLTTIADCDHLIVLQDGKVAEFDTPSNLIRREGGVFRAMYFSGERPPKLDSLWY
ncbi:P-loop containing nucleoside triphosphate hydrolase protein [Scleroderma citrinum]